MLNTCVCIGHCALHNLNYILIFCFCHLSMLSTVSVSLVFKLHIIIIYVYYIYTSVVDLFENLLYIFFPFFFFSTVDAFIRFLMTCLFIRCYLVNCLWPRARGNKMFYTELLLFHFISVSPFMQITIHHSLRP